MFNFLNNYEQHICKIENVKPGGGGGDKTNMNPQSKD